MEEATVTIGEDMSTTTSNSFSFHVHDRSSRRFEDALHKGWVQHALIGHVVVLGFASKLKLVMETRAIEVLSEQRWQDWVAQICDGGDCHRLTILTVAREHWKPFTKLGRRMRGVLILVV